MVWIFNLFFSLSHKIIRIKHVISIYYFEMLQYDDTLALLVRCHIVFIQIPHSWNSHQHPVFLASRDECPGSLCHSPGVGVGVCGMDKHFNLGHNFQTIKDRAFIFHKCIPYDKTFHSVP